MSHRHLGRLPPLQAIGRSQCVEEDEPPEISDSEVGQFVGKRSHHGSSYYYEPEHSDGAARALSHQFRILNPGSHVCKRTGQNTTSFGHCKYGVDFAHKYSQLRTLMETRSRLRLVRDYTSRISAIALFVKDVELITQAEYAMWYRICHNTVLETPETKLEFLNSICEDLRVHMGHWNSIKQLLHTDRWLKPLLPQLLPEMEQIKTRLHHLRDTAVWWIWELIHVGLRVLAHSDLERATDQLLWGVTRGIEDFNAIVAVVQSESPQNEGIAGRNPQSPRQSFGANVGNSYRNLAHSIKPIHVPKVLSLVASERCKYAAVLTHQFFAGGPELHRTVLRRTLPEYFWCEDFQMKATSRLRAQTDTSDYGTGSASTSLLRVAGMSAPDLSHEAPPLIDFSRREHHFAQKFLQMMSHSTKLLKKPRKVSVRRKLAFSVTPSGQIEETSNSPSLHHKEDGRVMLDTPMVVKPIRASTSSVVSDSFVLEGKDGKRKSVSWGDTSEASTVQDLSHQYMEILWEHFASTLLQFFRNPVWGGVDATVGQMGPVSLWPDVAVVMVVKMIQQTCVRDLFPPASVQSLCFAAKSLQVTTAWAAWSHVFRKVLASCVTDKCQGTPLAEGLYSTQTARLLREAFQPLRSTLETLDLTSLEEQHENDKEASARGVNPTLIVWSRTIQQLVITCDISSKWCHSKADSLLRAKALGAFLLVTQSDLKLLSDEMRHVLRACHPGSSNYQGSNQIEACLHKEGMQLWQQVTDTHAQMHALCSVAAKQFSEDCHRQAAEFFQDTMPPPGKVWRRKASQAELPSTHQEYVEHAVGVLLDPVVAGVSKLKTTAQLSAVSMAVTALGEAWTEHILKHKIRFSFCGAVQLQHDFAYIQTWLQSQLQNEEVRQSVLALEIFKYLSGAVDLLKKQPTGRTRSRTPNVRRRVWDQTSCEASTMLSALEAAQSTAGTASSGSECGSDYDLKDLSPNLAVGSCYAAPPAANGGMDPELMNMNSNYKMPHVEQWLSLRVHGGARGWPKLPSCFQPSASQM